MVIVMRNENSLSYFRSYLSVGLSLLQMDSPSSDTYRLSSLLRNLGEPSPRSDVMFLIVLSWGEVPPSYRLCMYYFPSIYFLSLISESCYHFKLPLTIAIYHIFVSVNTSLHWISFFGVFLCMSLFLFFSLSLEGYR